MKALSGHDHYFVSALKARFPFYAVLNRRTKPRALKVENEHLTLSKGSNHVLERFFSSAYNILISISFCLYFFILLLEK